MFTEIFILIILILINAFFAASEIALISLKDTRIRFLEEEGHKKIGILKKLLKEPSKFLATIQIGITLAGFLASAFAAESFSERLVNWVQSSSISININVVEKLSLIIITFILAYFTLVFGELVPKRIAIKKAEKISLFVVGPLNTLSIITAPFVKFLTISTNLFVRLAGIDPKGEDDAITEEEIRMMVDVGEEKGTIHITEKEMINNIFEFDNKTALDIMTPRINVVGISIDATNEQIMSMLCDKTYSRFPVYKGTIDSIIGLIHVKDLIPCMNNKDPLNINLQTILKQPYFVPSSKKTNILFKELQRRKNHMAIVIDEYGGTAGIVTMEDLVEEIVGNIFDEYDNEEKEIEKIDKSTYIVDGFICLDTISDFFNVDLPVAEYDTLSGFVVGQLGYIPENEETTSISYKGLIFTIDTIVDKSVKRVQIQLKDF